MGNQNFFVKIKTAAVSLLKFEKIINFHQNLKIMKRESREDFSIHKKGRLHTINLKNHQFLSKFEKSSKNFLNFEKL